MKSEIVADPESFNHNKHKTSKWFVAVAVLAAMGLIALSVWIYLSTR